MIGWATGSTPLGTSAVFRRLGDGDFVIDEQHRLTAVLRRGLGAHEVECKIYEHLTREQEEEMFILFNNDAKLSQFDAFKARAKTEDFDAEEVSDLLSRSGLTLVQPSGNL